MKNWTFTITVEDLPDQVRDYEVAGVICQKVTNQLRYDYGEQVQVHAKWAGMVKHVPMGKEVA